ncbi:interferon gamma [Sarcophilus harrisii]|uniref:Interferon gamma n=1 Tax=Sarcophilus harrisii TaxID=9305 RepID=G3WQJ9_SARHA|nr:interferon gamma [Sarcophilus harrisii]
MNYSSYLLASFLCVILSSSGCLSQVNLREDMQTLHNYFNATKSDVSDGSSLFMDMMKTWKEGNCDKKILMSHVVAVYFKIFEIFKNNSIVKRSMEHIREDMIMKLFPNNTASSVDDFEALINTQVNDLKVQRKAMFELVYVFRNLSPKPHLTGRRRRQNKSQGKITQ